MALLLQILMIQLLSSQQVTRGAINQDIVILVKVHQMVITQLLVSPKADLVPVPTNSLSLKLKNILITSQSFKQDLAEMDKQPMMLPENTIRP